MPRQYHSDGRSFCHYHNLPNWIELLQSSNVSVQTEAAYEARYRQYHFRLKNSSPQNIIYILQAMLTENLFPNAFIIDTLINNTTHIDETYALLNIAERKDVANAFIYSSVLNVILNSSPEKEDYTQYIEIVKALYENAKRRNCTNVYIHNPIFKILAKFSPADSHISWAREVMQSAQRLMSDNEKTYILFFNIFNACDNPTNYIDIAFGRVTDISNTTNAIRLIAYNTFLHTLKKIIQANSEAADRYIFTMVKPVFELTERESLGDKIIILHPLEILLSCENPVLHEDFLWKMMKYSQNQITPFYVTFFQIMEKMVKKNETPEQYENWINRAQDIFHTAMSLRHNASNRTTIKKNYSNFLLAFLNSHTESTQYLSLVLEAFNYSEDSFPTLQLENLFDYIATVINKVDQRENHIQKVIELLEKAEIRASIYNRCLNIFSCIEQPDFPHTQHSSNIIMKMEEHKIISSAAYNTFFKILANSQRELLEDTSWIINRLNYAQENHAVNEDTYALFIKILARCENPDNQVNLAYDLIQQASQNERTRQYINLSTYNAFFHLLSQCAAINHESIRLLDTFLHEAETRNCAGNTTYNCFLDLILKSVEIEQYMELAIKTIKKAKESGINDVLIDKQFLNILARCNNPQQYAELAIQTLETIENTNTADASTYQSFLTILARCRETDHIIERAWYTLDIMERQSYINSNAYCNFFKILGNCIRLSQADWAQHVLERAEANHCADSHVYEACLHLLAQSSNPIHHIQLSAYIIAQNTQPSAPVCNAFFHFLACCRTSIQEENLGLALTLLSHLEKNRLANAFTYNCFLNIFYFQNILNEKNYHTMFSEAQARQLVDAETYRIFFKIIAKAIILNTCSAGMLHFSLQLPQAARENNCADTETYLAFFTIFVNCKEADQFMPKIWETLEEAKRGGHINTEIYKTVIKIVASCRDPEQHTDNILNILETAKQQDWVDESVYSNILDILFKTNLTNVSVQIFEEAQRSGYFHTLPQSISNHSRISLSQLSYGSIYIWLKQTCSQITQETLFLLCWEEGTESRAIKAAIHKVTAELNLETRPVFGNENTIYLHVGRPRPTIRSTDEIQPDLITRITEFFQAQSPRDPRMRKRDSSNVNRADEINTPKQPRPSSSS